MGDMHSIAKKCTDLGRTFSKIFYSTKNTYTHFKRYIKNIYDNTVIIKEEGKSTKVLGTFSEQFFTSFLYKMFY